MSAAMSAAMAKDVTSPAYSATPFGAAQKQSQPRRMRPPDVTSPGYEDGARIPLKPVSNVSNRTLGMDPTRESNRDSRIGLRGFVARNRNLAENRASMTDYSGWHSHHSPQSTGLDPAASPSPKTATPAAPSAVKVKDRPESLQLPRQHPNPSPQTLHENPQPSQIHILQTNTITSAPGIASSDHNFSKPFTTPKSRAQAPPVRAARGSLATWDPPPLFQAYPQAIKHVQLPACTASIDTLLRAQSSRKGIDMHEPSASSSASPEDTALVGEKLGRANKSSASGSSMKLDWGSKIYVLVTSGYFLQYAAEGSFDRLPEKILPLNKDSSAFASDLIPGRHWVLRVCSTLEAGGSQSGDSRSLLSRLPFRGSDRRHASTLLLVFEGAEEMEGWITTLRREIEHLGGKKLLSETGTPKPDYEVATQKVQPTPRTLVVRDPERFSRIVNPQDVLAFSSRRRETHNAGGARDSHRETYSHEREPPTADDVSTTNSINSQDSRQLENLRDSLRDSNNRYSFISSGQRTMFTSDTSASPPCSPARDSFASNPNEEQAAPVSIDSPREVRPRPSASTVLERRQSLYAIAAQHRAAELHTAPQVSASPMDVQPQSTVIFTAMGPPKQPPPSGPPPPGAYASSFENRGHITGSSQTLPAASPPVPNFSVPHSSKRYSGVLKTPVPDIAPDAEPTSHYRHLQPYHQQRYVQKCQQQRQQQYQSLPQDIQQQQQQQQQHSSSPAGAKDNPRKLPPPSISCSRPLSIVTDHPSPAPLSAPLSHEQSLASIDNQILSTATCSSEAPPQTDAIRPSISSQRNSFSILKTPVSVKDYLTRASSTKDSLPIKTPKAPKTRKSLRSSLAAKFQSVVQSDSLSFAVPYTMALPVHASPLPENQNQAVPKQDEPKASTEVKETAPPVHKVTPLSERPPQLPELLPMPPMQPLARMSLLPLLRTEPPHGQQHDPRRAQYQSPAAQTKPASRQQAHPPPPTAAVQPELRIPAHRSSSALGGVMSRGRGHVLPTRPELPDAGHVGPARPRPVSVRASTFGYKAIQAISINGPPPAPPPTCALPPLPPRAPKVGVQ